MLLEHPGREAVKVLIVLQETVMSDREAARTEVCSQPLPRSTQFHLCYIERYWIEEQGENI
jgi:hypothetical protein